MPTPRREYPDGTKTCTTCGETKPLDGFYTGKRKDGSAYFRSPCKTCQQARMKQFTDSRCYKPTEALHTCIDCGETKPGTDFTPDSNVKRGHKNWCRECDALRCRMSKYGLTRQEVLDLRARGQCDCCGTTDPKAKYGSWHIDHCHETGKVRGLLCHPCNVTLGQVMEDPDHLRALIAYLESHQELAA